MHRREVRSCQSCGWMDCWVVLLLQRRFSVKHIFLVSEGQTDFEVLKAIIEKVLGEKYGGCTITPLFPNNQPDEDHGGWGNLRNWCRRQANTLVVHQGKLTAAKLLGGVKAEGLSTSRPSGDRLTAALALHGDGNSRIVIQLDTDVAEEFSTANDLSKFSFPLTASNRETLGKIALDEWLGQHSLKNGSSMIYCLSTHATETFLLSMFSQEKVANSLGHTGCNLNYDDLPKPERLLLAFGYAGKNVGGVRKLKKEVDRYREYSKGFATNLAMARGNSKILDKFCDLL